MVPSSFGNAAIAANQQTFCTIAHSVRAHMHKWPSRGPQLKVKWKWLSSTLHQATGTSCNMKTAPFNTPFTNFQVPARPASVWWETHSALLGTSMESSMRADANSIAVKGNNTTNHIKYRPHSRESGHDVLPEWEFLHTRISVAPQRTGSGRSVRLFPCPTRQSCFLLQKRPIWTGRLRG